MVVEVWVRMNLHMSSEEGKIEVTGEDVKTSLGRWKGERGETGGETTQAVWCEVEGEGLTRLKINTKGKKRQT